jgi:hypothetical protein
MQYEAENAKTLVLTICSIDGKVLHTEKLNENKGTKQIHFPYAKGMYLLSLTSDRGTKTAKVLAY